MKTPIQEKNKYLNKYLLLIIGVAMVAWTTFYLRPQIIDIAMYGWNDWPSHEADAGCFWSKKSFLALAFFQQECPELPASMQWHFSENKDGSIVRTDETKYGYSFKLQVFTKSVNESPMDVMQGLYAQLSPAEQTLCDIQDADEPVERFSDGRVHWTENPHPTFHKTRLKIDVNEVTRQEIMRKSEPGDTKYDYMCGHDVGTTLAEHSPYYEFDDRSPNKYLMVGSYGQEGPMIDLNSIHF
jgi:hypothetical protein